MVYLMIREKRLCALLTDSREKAVLTEWVKLHTNMLKLLTMICDTLNIGMAHRNEILNI